MCKSYLRIICVRFIFLLLIVSRVTKIIHVVGISRNGLYYIDTHLLVKIFYYSVIHPKHIHDKDLILWHHRLGHASLTSLKYIPYIKCCTTQSVQISVSCLMSKFTRLPFSLSTSHVTSAFKLVHMNIWGPYKTLYRSKCRYFLTLVDDFSQNSWIYLLQLKSNALTQLKSFLNYVSTKFSKTIQNIRSDNAL